MNGALTGISRLRGSRLPISGTWIVLGLVLVLTILISISYPIILVNTLVTGGMWALMAAGLALVFGVMNIPNFAHGEFFMIGTLTAYYVFTPIQRALRDMDVPILTALSPFAGMAAAIVVGALVGIFIETVLFRRLRSRSREGWVVNTFLLTAGVSVVIVNGTQLLTGTQFKGITRYWDVPPLEIAGVNVTVDRAVVFAIAVITILAFWQFMRRTDLGRAMRAVAQDEVGAQLMGIELNRVHVITLALSSALAALAGAALLFMFPSYPTVGLKPLYVAWYVVILAGLGNVQGAIIGGFLVALLQTLTSYFVGVGWEDVIPTALIIFILLLKPSGLFGSEVKGVWEQ
jgi:branched-chain amino acid transport system permease protein